MPDDRVAATARAVADARLARARWHGLPADLEPADEADAYRVQAALHDELAARGEGGCAGHKIGCTTPVMQEFLGIRNPCAGRVLEREVHGDGATVAIRGACRLGVECEVAVRLGADLPARPGGAPYARDEVAAAVAECMAAIEVVEDRYADYGALSTPTLIADDFFSAGVVLGAPAPGFDPRALDAARARMLIDGVEVGAGTGADVLGHPLEALAWLASSASARGLALRAGEFVMLGSLVATNWVEAGQEVVIENEPLGAVTVSFAAA